MKPVLVTSAAGGRQGKTGRHVAAMLLARGIPVRAFVRGIDERAEWLRSVGAEIFVGDLLDPRSVRRAVQGVSSIYFAYPVEDGLLDATVAMAVAARAADVSRLVNLVMLRSSLDAPTPRMRQNFLSEEAFGWARVGAVHVRAAVFYENIASLLQVSFLSQGVVQLPLGRQTTVLPLIAAEDVARVAVGLLTSQRLRAGMTYPAVGAAMSLGELVATFGRVLGRELQYESISDEEWRREAATRGVGRHAIEHLSALWRSLRTTGTDPEAAPFEVSDTIRNLGGSAPMTFEAFLRDRNIATPA